MDRLKFFVYQLSLFITLLVINVYADKYISKPFTRIDLLAISISLPLFILIAMLIDRSYKRFNAIQLKNRIVLSIIAFVFAATFLAFLDNIWFEITGKMLFF
ncbi:hypothetical protein ACSVDA_00205 [Cytobacillus sp. Hm23]